MSCILVYKRFGRTRYRGVRTASSLRRRFAGRLLAVAPRTFRTVPGRTIVRDGRRWIQAQIAQAVNFAHCVTSLPVFGFSFCWGCVGSFTNTVFAKVSGGIRDSRRFSAELESASEFFEKIGPTMPQELKDRRQSILKSLNGEAPTLRVAAGR